ncbi:MAG TPA: IPT/TIG domain-containing protein [Thermoanaerobaculia bacterium]|nr:IPT/TIG domain-containing protein [Thermoanaerobaculia bacterium]
MRYALRLSLLLLIAAPLFAVPVINSISPASGLVTGGAKVTIIGQGFNDNCIICSPPFGGLSVYFGNTQATSIKLINPTKIEATAPAHPPGTVPVSVRVMDGSNPNVSVLDNAFTYTGYWEPDFEPVLFPIYTPPIKGAFGAEFHSTARVASEAEPFDIFGYDTNCTLIDPPILPDRPFRIGTGETVLDTRCNPGVGRLFFVPAAHVEDFAANLRVTDITRQAQSHGVEVPVVRLRDFTTSRIVLLGVPIDPRVRNTLRIYGLPGGAQSLIVTIGDVARTINLQEPASMYEPSYAQFSDFPVNAIATDNTISVTIDQMRNGIVPPTAVWAMVSVTNNDTQQITLVTP